MVSHQGGARLFVPVVRPSLAPDCRDAFCQDPHSPANVVLCDLHVHDDAQRCGGEGIAAPARSDLQNGLAHGRRNPQAYATVDGDVQIGGPGKVVEADETFVGGEARGAGSGFKKNKTIVFGMVERGGDVVTQIVPSRHAARLVPHMQRHIVPGSEVHTDEFGSYDNLAIKGFDHKRVNHRAGEYVREGVGVNTIEGFWAQLKRTISGTHIHVSGKHLPKYAKEVEYRFNRRDRPETMLAELLGTFGPLKPQSD